MRLYTSPIGDSEENPSDEFIEGILTNGDTYWQDPLGRGHGTLDILVSGAAEKTLEITAKAGFGFYLMVTERSPKAHRHFIAIPSEARSNIGPVKVNYGGEPYFIPSAFFLSPELARKAAHAFLHKGERSAEVVWAPLESLDWDPDTGAWKGSYS